MLRRLRGGGRRAAPVLRRRDGCSTLY